MTNRRKAYIALLVNAFFWGISGPIIKNGLNYISPALFLFYRFLIVVILITPFFLFYLYKNKVKVRNLPILLLIGLLSNPINLFLLFLGLNITSALDTAVLASLTPLFFYFFGAVFLKEKINSQEKLGLIIALGGTMLFTLQPLLSPAEKGQSSLAGNLLVILANLFYVASMILAKKNNRQNGPFVQAYFSWLSALIFFTLIFLFSNNLAIKQLSNIFTSPALPNILYMVFFGSIVAFFAYVYGQSKIETSEASVFTYLQPLFAAPLAVFWLGEKITFPFILGCIFIIAGVVLSESRKKLII